MYVQDAIYWKNVKLVLICFDILLFFDDKVKCIWPFGNIGTDLWRLTELYSNLPTQIKQRKFWENWFFTTDVAMEKAFMSFTLH